MLRPTIILMCGVAVCSVGYCQTDPDDRDPRPLRVALERLQHRFGWHITYEDAPVEFAGDIVDVTDLEYRRQHPGARGAFNFRSAPIGAGEILAVARPDEALKTVERLVEAQNNSGNPGKFVVVQRGQVIHVIPVAARDKDGAVRPVKPIMETRVTIPVEPRTPYETLRVLCSALVKAGVRYPVNPGVMGSWWTNAQVSVGGENVTAREFLERMIEAGGRPMTWQLLCEAGGGMCGLSVQAIVVEVRGPSGERVFKALP